MRIIESIALILPMVYTHHQANRTADLAGLCGRSIANLFLKGDFKMNINCNCVHTDKGDLTVMDGKPVLIDRHFPMNIKVLVIDDDELLSKLTPDKFRGYLSVEKIVLTDNVRSIPDCAFAHYSFLRTITLPKTLRSIGKYAFLNCYRLYNIVIPEGVEKIEEGTFYKCNSLHNVYLPDSVSEIGERAFYDCRNLERVYGGRGVKKIADLAFADTKVHDLPFGDALCECGTDAFLRSWDVPTRARFFCDEQFGIALNENGEFVIDENERVLEDRSVDFGNAVSVILPESVRNISRYAFVSSIEKDTPQGDELIKLLPEKMNMPKNYFIGNASHDYVMSFLLADTVWKEQVSWCDLVQIFLYHNDENARAEARRRLCKEHNSVLYEMLFVVSFAPEKVKLMERVGEYAAAYLSDLSEYVLSYFYKRAKKIRAHNAIDTVVKQSLALLNTMPNEEEDHFGTDGLEPFFAKEFFDAFTRRTDCDLQLLHSIGFEDFRNGSYASDELILSILYAYTKQVTTNVSDIIEVPHEFDIHICEKADEAAALLDEESFMLFVDSLDSTAHGGLFMPFVCRFGSEEKIVEVISKCPPELHDLLIASLAISETDQAELFLADHYYGSSAEREETSREDDEYDEEEYDESEYELADAENFGCDEGELDDEYDEEEYYEEEYDESEYELADAEDFGCDEGELDDEYDEEEYDEEEYDEEEEEYDYTEGYLDWFYENCVETSEDAYPDFDVDEKGVFVVKPKKE